MPATAVQADTREAILDAIERLLARFGYKKTTMDDLAREAGIGKGSIYLHFPSKEEVALSSIDRVVDRVQERLRELASSDASAAERLRRMLIERVMIRIDCVQAYSQSLDDLFELLRPAYMARRSRYFAAETKIFAAVLAQGSQEGELDVADPTATAHTLLLATNSLLPYSLSVRELGKRAEIARSITHLANLLLHGLFRRASAEAKMPST